MVRDWSRNARMSLARLPTLIGLDKAPDEPAYTVRDLWSGDPAEGARLLKGELHFSGFTIPFGPGLWQPLRAPESVKRYLSSFVWLRHLRALGTDTARIRARAQVGDWFSKDFSDTTAFDPSILGTRLAAWLAHYDFFAASADDQFRSRLMHRLLQEGRIALGFLSSAPQDDSFFLLLKGMLSLAVAMPEHNSFLARFFKYLDPSLTNQLYPDGTHKSRSPLAQMHVLRDLVEIRSLLLVAHISVPDSLVSAIDRMSAVLRAMRYGDGKLALFNGGMEQSSASVDMILSHATRLRLMATSFPQGQYVRCAAGQSLLFIDAGPLPERPFAANAHAGLTAFEFSAYGHRIIVNCGSSLMLRWQEVLRETVAHSTVSVGHHSLALIQNGDIVHKPLQIKTNIQNEDGAHLVEITHDGFMAVKQTHHKRRLFLDATGENLRGEDTLTGPACWEGEARFHLHPSVRVEGINDTQDKVILSFQDEMGKEQHWSFQTEGGRMRVEESVYLPNGQPLASTQLVVAFQPTKEIAPLEEEASELQALSSDHQALVPNDVADASASIGETVSLSLPHGHSTLFPQEDQPSSVAILRWGLTRLRIV